jgi:urocanate hydratase
MSGAQGKAAAVCKCIGIIAEVDEAPLKKRFNQGWIQRIISDLDELVEFIKTAKAKKDWASIGFHGNVVALWQRLAEENELLVDLGSDQTSLHNPYGGGYTPVQLSFEESQKVMVEDPKRFKELVQESLRRQVHAINKLASKGMYFWDYGNCFLLESSRAGADINDSNSNSIIYNSFKYPSYVQHIMGDIFSLGFGPFRWICASGNHADLQKTDKIALDVMKRLMKASSSDVVRDQYVDNIFWIERAEENRLVVGSESRILYADAEGRVQISLAFNEAIKRGEISGPVILSRDHHDVSGTDSPFRETSNIYDGSSLCADMAIQNVIGDSFRGATWVSIHNGGGVGWGEVTNGGFGMVLDGSEDSARRAESMLSWDVFNGLARRAWSGHPYAQQTMERAMQSNPKVKLTSCNQVDQELLKSIL